MVTWLGLVDARSPILPRSMGQGHADANERRAAELGAARAEAVKAMLVSRGVPPEQLVARSYGADRPVCPERTQACRSRNRRVEFLIIRNR